MPDSLFEGKYLLPSTYDNQYNPIIIPYNNKNFIGNNWAISGETKGYLNRGYNLTFLNNTYLKVKNNDEEDREYGSALALDNEEFNKREKEFDSNTILNYNTKSANYDLAKKIPTDRLHWLRIVNSNIIGNSEDYEDNLWKGSYENSLAEYYGDLIKNKFLKGNNKLDKELDDRYYELIYEKDVAYLRSLNLEEIDLETNNKAQFYITKEQFNEISGNLLGVINGLQFKVNNDNNTLLLDKNNYFNLPNKFFLQSVVLWSSKYNNYNIIWYSLARQNIIEKTNENENLNEEYNRYFLNNNDLIKNEDNDKGYLINLAKESYNFLQSDNIGFKVDETEIEGLNIIINTTKELGLEVKDILNLADYFSDRTNLLTYNAKKVFKICQNAIDFYNEIASRYLSLKKRAKNTNTDKYLFVKEDNAYFHNCQKTYFNFIINQSTFKDLDINIGYIVPEPFDKNKSYEIGDYVFGPEASPNEIDPLLQVQKYVLYRCLIPYHPLELEEENRGFHEFITHEVDLKLTDQTSDEKSIITETQWHMVSRAYAEEMQLLDDISGFNPNDYYRFVLPAIEDEAEPRYEEGTGALLPNRNEGEIAFDIKNSSEDNSIITLKPYKHRYYIKAEKEELDALYAAEYEEAAEEDKENVIRRLPTFHYTFNYSVGALHGEPSNVLDKFYKNPQTIYYIDYFTDDDKSEGFIEDDYVLKEHLILEGVNTDEIGYYINPNVSAEAQFYNDNRPVVCYFKKNTDEEIKVSVIITNEVQRILNNAFDSMQELTKVVFGRNVNSIGNESFYNCQNLKHVLFPKSLEFIGQRAFASCIGLRYASIPPYVSSLNNTYIGCTNLRSITLHSNLKEIGNYTFCNCENLEYVYGTSGLTTLGIGAFSGCKKLKRFIIPEAVSEIPDRAFQKCTIADIVINNKKITYLGAYSFESCEKITETIDFKYLTEYKPGSYKNCKNLKRIQFKWNKDDEKRLIPESFCEGCTELKEIIFEDQHMVEEDGEEILKTFGPITIDNRAFYNCVSLGIVTIPDDVRVMGSYAFYACYNLKLIQVPSSYKASKDDKSILNVLGSGWLDRVINPANRNNWIDNTVTDVMIKGGGIVNGY